MFCASFTTAYCYRVPSAHAHGLPPPPPWFLHIALESGLSLLACPPSGAWQRGEQAAKATSANYSRDTTLTQLQRSASEYDLEKQRLHEEFEELIAAIHNAFVKIGGDKLLLQIEDSILGDGKPARGGACVSRILLGWTFLPHTTVYLTRPLCCWRDCMFSCGRIPLPCAIFNRVSDLCCTFFTRFTISLTLNQLGLQ